MRTDKLQDLLEETINLSYDDWVDAISEHELGEAIVYSLKDLPQYTKYHPEFCCLKHTWLVLQAVKRLNEPKLYEAALLHDWGKDGTTYIQSNKISSAGHAQESAKRVLDNERYITDLHFTWWIVKRHMDFDLNHKRFKSKGKYDEPYIDLETFIMADKHMSRGLFFELFSRDDHYKALQAEIDTYRQFAEADRTLYVTVGIQGSGKSTYVNEHFDSDIIVSTDMIRKEINGDIHDHSNADEVWNTAIMRLFQNLRDNGEAVFDATNCFKYQRQMRLARLCSLPHRRVGLLFEADVSDATIRVKSDIAQNKERANVPPKHIKKFQKGLQKSKEHGLKDEFHEMIIIET